MPDIIDQLLAMDDDALAKRMGFSDKIADLRKDLGEAATLEPEDRSDIAESIKRSLEPNLYAGDIRWKVEDAKHRAERKTAKGQMLDTDPMALED